MLAHLMYAATGAISVETLFRALLEGDVRHKADAYLGMLDVVYEYDDATWHDQQAVDRDVRKTAKLLAYSDTLKVLRLRVGDAPPLQADHPAVADDRTLVVETSSRSVGKVVTVVARALVGVVPEPYAQRLAAVAERGYKRKKCVDEVVHEAFLKMDQAYTDELAEAARLLDGDVGLARKLLGRHGVKTRLATGGIASTLRLFRILGMAPAQLARLPGCMWARAGTKILNEMLTQLLEMGVKVEQLQTFQDSFWKRAGTDVLNAMLDKMLKMGVKVEHLQSFGGSFWTRTGTTVLNEMFDRMLKMGVKVEHLKSFGDCFWKRAGTIVLNEMLDKMLAMGVNVEHLKSFGDCFWKKSGTDVLNTMLDTMLAMGVRVEHLKSFNGCFWKRAGTELLNDTLQMLLDRKVHIDNLKTFGCRGSFWAAMETTGFDVVDTLIDTYGVSVVDLHKLHSDFWSHFAKPEDWGSLKAELAACPTSGAVTALLRKNNGNPRYSAIGAGATRCMFSRPIHRPTPVAPPPTKQASLTSYFK